MTKKISKKGGVILVVLVVLITSSYLYFNREEKVEYDLSVAQKRNLVEEVSVTGRVKPVDSVNLAFEKSGRVSYVNVEVGDNVFAGQVLMRQGNAELVAQLAQNEAELKSQEAKLSELTRGTRPEEIKIQEVKVTNAEVSVSEAKKNIVDKMQDAYTKSDDAIRNRVDQFFSNPRSTDPKLVFSVNDFQLDNDIRTKRVFIEGVLDQWLEESNQIIYTEELTLDIASAKENLTLIKDFLDKVSFSVNSLLPTSTLTQTTIDGWKTDISTARTNTNTAIVNLSTAHEKLKTSESNLLLEENQLILKKSGTREEQILAQEAIVEKAMANIQNTEAQISKTILRSPISGIVSKKNISVGEIISANSSVVSVISKTKFEIETNAPEADIAKIKIGDNADITLDAYGDDVVFKGSVAVIDPAETIIEGVSTYKVTLHFLDGDDRVRSGMTANIDIYTGMREGVIAVPQRSVITRNGQKIIRVLKSDMTVEERFVEVGLRGSGGYLEIVSGLNEGERVIVFIK